ncbi:MAG: hypothetical protein NTX49_01065 [Chlamydiae bacterium]|nr:hypothetical protein [Chlamydiota bacterium]
MRAFFWILLTVCKVSLLFSDTSQDVFSRADGEPSSYIEGCVSAITGDLVILEEDIHVEGLVPISIKRQYVSSQYKTDWTFYEHLTASFVNGVILISTKEPNGTRLVYRLSNEDHKRFTDGKKRKHLIKLKKKGWVKPFDFILTEGCKSIGLANSSKGGISGRANLKNNRIELDVEGEVFSVISGDGTTRIYKLISGQKDKNKPGDSVFFHLQEEILPSKQVICYFYDKYHRLDCIATKSPDRNKVYASVRISYPDHKKDPDHFRMETSDGRSLFYKSHRLKAKNGEKYWMLESIQSSFAPEESLSHTDKSEQVFPLINRRNFSDGRVLGIDYYHLKHNTLGPNVVYLKNDSDTRYGRVKALLAPVGADSSLHTIYSFYYDLPTKDKHSGHTSVYDLCNTETRYHYNERMELSRIDTASFEGHHIPYSSERFVWGSPDSPYATNILCRSFIDGRGQALFARQFGYDGSGNVTEDKFLGNITGSSEPLLLGGDDQPIGNGVECCVRKMSYTDDGKNLLKEAIELNGSKVIYQYLADTDLITLKATSDKGEIKQRIIYEYKDNILAKEIIDDGRDLHPASLSGVTERRIRIIHPIPDGAYVGLPLCVEDRYLDLRTGLEVLLQKTEYTYTTGGLISEKRICDAEGHYRYTLDYKYDAKGNLIEETNVLGEIARSSYDIHSNKVGYTGFDGKITLKMDYDYSNRLIQTEEHADGKCHITSNRYDLKSNKIATTDSFGNTTEFLPDSFGNTLQVRSPSILSPEGMAIYPIIKRTYDCMGRQTSETNPEGETKYISYNVLGKPIKIDYCDGSTETFIYNLDGTLSCHTDVEGLSTSYEYDYLSRVTKKIVSSNSGEIFSEESSTYNAFHLLSVTDIEGNTTRYIYDGAGRVVSEGMIGKEQTRQTDYTYDSLGRIQTTTLKGDPEDLITYTERDLSGRVIAEYKQDPLGKILSKQAYTYDAAGHILQKTSYHQGSPSTEYFSYDGFGRLTTQTDPLGNKTHIEYDESYYNTLGQRVLKKITTDPSGLQVIEIHDALGKIASVEQKNSFGTTLSLEENRYDASGHTLKKISHVYYQGKESKQLETLWEYGLLGRLTTLIEASESDTTKITHYEYTPKGLLSSILKPAGVCLSYEYDPMGRMVALSSSDGSCSYEFVYNLMHQMTELIDNRTGKRISRSYSSFGQMTKEILPSGASLENTYDCMGRRKELIFSDGSSVDYSYDAMHLRAVTRHAPSGACLYSHTYDEYDESGALLTETLIKDLGVINRAFDPLGRVEQLVTPFISEDSFSYDEVGHLLSYQTKSQGSTKEEFSYDALGQITSEMGTFSHVFDSDSLYNRREKDSLPYKINDLNELLSDSHSDYTYDSCGNLRCKRNSHEEILYDYDALERLISITSHGEYKLVFEYDGLHRRTSTTSYDYVEGEVVLKDLKHYLYDGQNEIGATDDSGSITELRILGSTSLAEIGSAVALELHGNLYAPIHDFRGNVIAIVDAASQQVVEEYKYSAFGEERIFNGKGARLENSSLGNLWRFASKRVDEETGLSYFGRRFYDPQVGRFITCDPKGFSDSMNLYAFVFNNPLTTLDLYGLEAVTTDTSSASLWQRSWNASCNALRSSTEFLGGVIYNFFHHCVPIPGLRDGGRYIGSAISGKNLQKEAHSASYITEGTRLNSKSLVAYSSGQACDPKESREQSKQISDSFSGEQVQGFHNSTRGLLLDTLESAALLLGFHTSTLDKTTKWMRECIDKVGGVEGDGVVNWIAWSQGAIMAKRVLENLTPEEKKHLVIRGIAALVGESGF